MICVKHYPLHILSFLCLTIQLTAKQQPDKTICVKNTITPEMLTYKHWTGNYTPETFSVEVDGVEIKQGEEKQLVHSNKSEEAEVVYKYSFAKGLYKGTRTCKVKLPEKISHASLAFSWKENPRMWVECMSDPVIS